MARRVLVLGMIAALAPFLLAPVAHAESADDELTGYVGSASAAIFSFKPIFPGLLPTGDAPFEITGGLTTSNAQSGGQAFSRAEILWPGDGASDLGPLLGEAANNPLFFELPKWPLGVSANQDSDTVSQGVTPGPVLKAAGKDGKAESVAQAGGGGLPGIFTFGSVSSSSKSDVVNGQLVCEATVVLHDVVLGAGQVTMDAVKSIATATSNGATSESKGNTVVSGLAINGQGGAIDSEGLKGAAPLVKAMNDASKSAAIELTVADGLGKAEGGTADRLSAGLIVNIKNPLEAANPAFKDSHFVLSLAPTAAGAMASPPFESISLDTGAAGSVNPSGGFSSVSGSISDVYGAPTSSGPSVSSGGGGQHGLPAVLAPISKVFPDVGGVSGGMVLALLAGIVYGSRLLTRFANRFISTED